MALSKQQVSDIPLMGTNRTSKEIVNKLEISQKVDCDGLNIDEIMHYVKISQKNAISIEIIKHLVGGPNMDYNCMEVDESITCYKICRNLLIDTLQKTKRDILFFEDRQTTNSNVIIAVVRKPRDKNCREHVVFWAAVRFTLMLEPKVGFCRSFDLTCKFVLSISP